MNRELLEQPFERELVKTRKGNFGATLEYFETHVIIQRLNDAFAGNWSFRIVEHIQTENEVIVLGELAAEGIVKQQFGGSKITKAKNSDVTLSIGDDLKAAASDCIKKCSTLLGVGLELYGARPKGKKASPPKPAAPKPKPEPAHEPGDDLRFPAPAPTTPEIPMDPPDATKPPDGDKAFDFEKAKKLYFVRIDSLFNDDEGRHIWQKRITATSTEKGVESVSDWEERHFVLAWPAVRQRRMTYERHLKENGANG